MNNNVGRPNPGTAQINGVWIFSPAHKDTMFDGTLMFNSCVIFEDMFSPFITGEITFIDTENMLGRIPIIGQETIYMSLSTPYDDRVYTDPETNEKMSFAGEFIISSVKEKVQVSDKAVKITLGFASKESFYDITHPFSKGYQGSPSDIAYSVLTDEIFGLNTEKRLLVENTKNQIQYVSNYWTPIENLNYLIENSVNENDSPSYVFFENKNGFNFVSIDTLISKELTTKANIPSFKVDKSTQLFEKTGTLTNYEMSYSRVDKIRYINNSSFFERALRGMLGSTIISPDVNNQDAGAITKTLDYAQFFTKQANHLNAFSVVNSEWTQNPLTKLIVMPIQTNSKVASQTQTASPRTNEELVKKESDSIAQLEENLKANTEKLATLTANLNRTKDAKAKADIQADIDSTKKTIEELNKSIAASKSKVETFEKNKENEPSDSGWSQTENQDGTNTKTKTVKDIKGNTTVYTTVYKDDVLITGKRDTTSIDGKVESMSIETTSTGIKKSNAGVTTSSSEIKQYSDENAKIVNEEYQRVLDEFSDGKKTETVIDEVTPSDGVNSNVDYILQRHATISSFADTLIEIDVLGRFNYFVGMIVELTVPKTITTPNDWIDKLNSGKYLVTALKHSILHNRHVCTLELSRDSSNLQIE